MKNHIITILFLAFTQFACGQQYNNSLKMETGDFIIPGIYNPKLKPISRLARQQGVFFQHRFHSRLSLSVGVSWWNANLFLGDPNYYLLASEVFSVEHHTNDVVTLSRSKYKMLDLSGGYNLLNSKRHALNINAGVSLAKGIDYYTIDPYPLPFSYYGNYVNDYSQYERDVAHFGVFSQVSYDYRVSKGHFSIGGDFKCRKYFAFQSVELDYGVHVGWNF